MKTLKAILSAIVLVAYLFQLGGGTSEQADPDQSTTCQNVTINYSNEVPRDLAQDIAGSLDKMIGKNGPITLGMKCENCFYILETGVVDNTVENDFRHFLQLATRVLIDLHSPDKAIVADVSSDSGELLARVKPVQPMGNFRFHGGNYLFTSENISAEEAATLAEGLEEIGYFDSGGVARVVRAEDEYVIHLSFDLDEKDSAARDIEHDAITCQSNLFDGAKTKVVYSEIDMEPVGQELSYTVDGHVPGQSPQQDVELIAAESQPENATASLD